MFHTNESFRQWLTVHGTPLVCDVLERQSESDQTAIREIFEKTPIHQGFDMTVAARTLGVAVAQFVDIGFRLSGFDVAATRATSIRTFAAECGIALARLIHRGLDGTQSNALVPMSGDPQAYFATEEQWELQFVRPLAEQSAAEVYKRLKNHRPSPMETRSA